MDYSENTSEISNMKTASIITHLAAAALLSTLAILIYAAVQQSYRSAANDPQIQIARDIANDIGLHRAYHDFINSMVNPQQSLAPFIQLYDGSGQLILSGNAINQIPFTIPKGVLTIAKQHGENVVTWQPAAGVRLAAVAEYTGNTDTAYVVAARSLQEVENRERNLRTMVIAAWAVGCCIIAMHGLIQRFIIKQ